MKKSWVSLFIVLLFVSPRIWSQSTGRLYGRITDPQGRVVTGAAVLLRGAAAVEKTAVSDRSGKYEFTELGGGPYDIQVTAKGFAPIKQTVMVKEGPMETLDLSLTVQHRMEVVTVTAARSERDAQDTPEPLFVVSRQTIEEKNRANVIETLRELPGVALQSGGPFSTRPIIRGLDGVRVLLLVDGIRFNNSRQRVDHTGGGEAVEAGLIDIGQVESVEIIRGGGSVLYGSDALGGTLNIITKEADRPTTDDWHFGGELNSRYIANGAGLRGDGTLTASHRRWSFRAQQALEHYSPYAAGSPPSPSFLGYFGTAGPGARYRTSDFLDDRKVRGTGLTGRNTTLEGRAFLTDKQSLRLQYMRRQGVHFGIANSTTTVPFSTLDRAALIYQGHSFTPWLTQVSGTLYTQRLHRDLISITDTRLPFIPPNTAPLYSYQESILNPRTTGYDTQAVLVPARRHILTVGTNYFRDHNRDTTVLIQGARNLVLTPEAARALVAQHATRSGLDDAFRQANNAPIVPNGGFRDLGWFAQEEYEVSKRLRLIGGLRYDRFLVRSEVTDNFSVLGGFFDIPELALPRSQAFKSTDGAVTGNFGVIVRPLEALSFSARLGHTFHEPGIFERFNASPNHAIISTTNMVTAPNPDLKPETGWNLDVGVKLRMKRLAAEFNYFNNTFANFIASTPVYINNDPALGQRTVLQPPAITPLYVFRRTNLNRIRLQGFEAQLEVPLEIGRQRMSFAGNLSRQKGDDLRAHVPLDPLYYPAMPLHSVLGLRWDKGIGRRYWAEYNIRMATRADRFPPNSESSFFRRVNLGGFEPGYVVHDVRGGYNIPGEHTTYVITLGLENIGNRFYWETFNISHIPALGRAFTLGLKLKFY